VAPRRGCANINAGKASIGLFLGQEKSSIMVTIEQILGLAERLKEQETRRAEIVTDFKEMITRFHELEKMVSLAERTAMYMQFENVLQEYLENISAYNSIQEDLFDEFEETVFKSGELAQ
jgi:predicted transcriptional regulator